MEKFDLCGEWNVRKKDGNEPIPAMVPGCIHTDLLTAGKIDDPYYRDNEAQQMWIGETDWLYSRAFSLNADFLKHAHILLRCEGLDTFAAISVNGSEIAKSNNQFRTWEFDLKSVLQEGENRIEICFDSTLPFIQEEQWQRYLNLTGVGEHRIDGSNRIRKSQCNYGWDWGPMCVSAGIWRPISLVAFDTARLKDLHIIQDHSNEHEVGLEIHLSAEQYDSLEATAHITLLYEDEQIDRTDIDLQEGRAKMQMRVEAPRLWWPNGMGDQALYDLRVELSEGERLLDTVSKKIGLRTLELDRHPDQWGESFQFVVNGKPFFAKGANWIPADTFVTRAGNEQYEFLIKSAADSNMNMLRVWGGGIYENDVFYELCDRYGICVWQDFMFACSAYPAFDEQFMENVRREIEQNVAHLRHHPSIALWCGNNELEHLHQMFLSDTPQEGFMTWEEYSSIFDELIPEVLQTCDPERAYWPSSSHSPYGDRKDPNNSQCGDAHLWEVWHGRQPFEWYRRCEHRFNSEFGFQSFPEPAVVHSYTAESDRNISSYIMEWHQRSGIGNDAIIQYMLSWFQLPTSFDMLLWLSQILQGMGIKYAVEHWRRSMPRGMGTLYWQLNDCWPVASWSSIDYFGNWKALHYMARDFFAPLLLSAIENPEDGSVEVHVTSDLPELAEGRIRWILSDTSGNILAENTLVHTNITPCGNTKACLLQFHDHLKEYGKRRLLLWLELVVEDNVVSQQLVFFSRPKHLELQKPELRTEIREDGSDFLLSIDTVYPALWVWPELVGVKAAYSKRFFHLFPGRTVEVRVQPEKKLSLEEFKGTLNTWSLLDTF
ncbi:MAG: glycoside hydrolase family 2 protein [bacterium]|nr:glycoside hydrolase family 2 protein [bacterium]